MRLPRIAFAACASEASPAGAAGGTNTRPRLFESNQLFDYSDSRISKRDSALRLRFVGDQAWLTYKGPNHGSGKIKKRRGYETLPRDGRGGGGALRAPGRG